MATRQPLLTHMRCALRPRPRARQLNHQSLLRRPCHRHNTTIPPPPPPNPSSDRISKILSRLPPRLQKYTSRLRAAPVSHMTAFLILHELTAIVPLVALFGVFHYYINVGPIEAWMRGHYGTYVSEGVGKFERYFKRKGWFGFGEGDEAIAGAEGLEGGVKQGVDGSIAVGEETDSIQAQKYKVVVEVALAYAITKAFLPLRIIASVWATPWFAGVLLRLRRIVRPVR